MQFHGRSYYLLLVERRRVFFFFFSSRRRHTRCGRDWSSDVCSSDLWASGGGRDGQAADHTEYAHEASRSPARLRWRASAVTRSEERRVGKEGRSRGSAYH